MSDPEDIPDGVAGADPSAEEKDYPQPSLRTFVSGMAGQVIISLGLVKNPSTGSVEVNLHQAKYSIDLLQILYDKMHGNLSDEEEQLFQAVLYDLRMRYVEVCR